MFAFAALDAFPVTDLFHIHLTGMHTGVTAIAFLPVDLNAEKRDRVEQGIDRTKRAKETTKRAKTEHAKQQDRCQYKYFPGKKKTGLFLQLLIQEDQRDSCFQCPRRTDVFTETRYPIDERDQDDKYNEDHIFDIGKRARDAVFFDLWERDLVKKILQKAKWAKKAADQASEKKAGQKQEAEHIKGKPI